jgi:thiamine-monophosphate kinase
MKSIDAESVLGDALTTAGEKRLADVGEKALLSDFLLPLCEAACGNYGLGDDAGILKVPDASDIVVTTDRVPSDLLPRQFGLMSPVEYGSYLIRVNVSDLAAMGASPLGMVITCAFEPTERVSYVIRVMWGAYTESWRLGCPVVGGDTKAGAAESISATAVGAVPRGRAVGRGPITPGMRMFLSGPVGHAGVALRWFARKVGQGRSLIGTVDEVLDKEFRDYLVRPRPRVDLAASLIRSGCPCAMDITDGLGQSLREICKLNGVDIELDYSKLVFYPNVLRAAEYLGLDMRAVIGGIGIDLELVAIDQMNPDPDHFYEAGTVREGFGNVIFSDGRPMDAAGFEHFKLPPREFLQLLCCACTNAMGGPEGGHSIWWWESWWANLE